MFILFSRFSVPYTYCSLCTALIITLIFFILFSACLLDMGLRSLQPNAFVREELTMGHHIFTYLGIQEGPQSRLVLAWSPSANLNDLFMFGVRALERMVDSPRVQDYRIVVDPELSFVFILCPDELDAEFLRARYVSVGDIKFFFELVRNAKKILFHDDNNCHARVYWWV